MKIKPFERHGNYTVFDNALLDRIMPVIRPTSWVVLSYILRRTIGWQRDREVLSYTNIRTGTGIKSDTTINQGVQELVKLNLIYVIESSDDWTANTYCLNRSFVIDVPTPKNGVVPTPKNGESYIKKEKKLIFPQKEYLEIIDLWGKLFPNKGQPRPGTASYRTSFARRWKEPDFRENWARALGRAAGSNYLQEKTQTKAKWFCFQWFITNDSNWQKCLDGNYDDNGQSKNGGASSGEADKAWGLLKTWMLTYGSRKEPPQLLDITKKAIRLVGGYKKLCSMETFDGERAFKTAYKEAGTGHTST